MMHDAVTIYWKNGTNTMNEKVQLTFDADDLLRSTSATGGWLYVNLDEALSIVGLPAPKPIAEANDPKEEVARTR